MNTTSHKRASNSHIFCPILPSPCHQQRSIADGMRQQWEALQATEATLLAEVKANAVALEAANRQLQEEQAERQRVEKEQLSEISALQTE